MDEACTPCNFLAPTVLGASIPVEPGPVPIAKRILKQAAPVYRQVRDMISPEVPVLEIEPLNLEPGEWVEVRPLEEIRGTLDRKQKYKGLVFMPEMAEGCGRKYRVLKKVATILLEPTGEVRRLKSPTVFLEGSYCKGERHQGCDRACFHFWREAWLKRIPGPGAS